MSTHVPDAPYAAIHSVCIHPDYRGRGIALSLLKAYLARLSDSTGIQGARLITHDNLVKLYAKAAFELVGPSAVVHGAHKWYEMKVDFGGASGVDALKRKAEESRHVSAVASPAGSGAEIPTASHEAEAGHKEAAAEKYDEKATAPVDESEDEGEVRNPGKKWRSFGGKLDSLADSDGLNKAGLYCPQAGCRCLLLRPGAGKWVRPTDRDFDVSRRPLPSTGPLAPPPRTLGSLG